MAKLNLEDPRFALHGDKSQCPRYISAPAFSGFIDCCALVELTPGAPLRRVMFDGSIVNARVPVTFSAMMSCTPNLTQQVSALAVAALIYERNKENN